MPTEAFPRIDVTTWPVVTDETSGVEEKMWLEEPGTETRWLYKSVTSDGGYICGEDWAEKVVAELGAQLAVPCARVELAQNEGRRGSISENLRPAAYEMQHGGLLMVARGVQGFVLGRAPGRPGHSLENIQQVLEGALPPPGCLLPFEASAFDVFAGYLVLDAVVANRDRHDENWSVLRPIADGGPLLLCPSYDHANSLGYNLTDEKRQLWLSEPGAVRRWCLRGTAYRFEHTPGKAAPTLVQLAATALGLVSARTREHWIHQLERVEEDAIRSIVGQIPGMSDAAGRFALEVMLVNRKRVLDACT